MAIHQFLEQLFEHGRVTVSAEQNETNSDTSKLPALLEQLDALYRMQLPAGLPKLEMNAAIYGAQTICRACQLLAYRDFTDTDIQSAIQIPTMSPNPAVHLSVDLALHFLPDAVRLARAAAP